MLVSGYELHIYCDCCDAYERRDQNKKYHPAVYTGSNYRSCIRQSLSDGFKFDKARKRARCPACVKEKRKWPETPESEET